MTNMLLLVGLGNPGEKYKETRHNTGYIILEGIGKYFTNLSFKENKKLKADIVKTPKWIFARPLTYMNNSGLAVKKLLGYYKVKLGNLWVIHDDLDLPLGSYKIQKGRGPKLHYGIASIDKTLKDKQYLRIRVGIENRTEKEKGYLKGEDYVLEKFSRKEREIINGVIEEIVSEIKGKI